MKLTKGWKLNNGRDEIIVESWDHGTIRWAKRHKWQFTRVFILK